MDFIKMPYNQATVNGEILLSVGGSIGQSHTHKLLLRKAHLEEVSVTVWPKIFKEMCRERKIHVLD